MTVLHIYDESNSMAAQYVAMLSSAMDPQVTMQIATTALSFNMLYDAGQHPIVHLHGKSPFPLPQGIRLVVSPHGSTMADVSHAYVIIARSRMEHDALVQRYPRVETILNPIITRAITPDACASQMLQVYQRVMDSNVLQLFSSSTRHFLALILGTAVAGDVRWVLPNGIPEHTPPYFTLSPVDFRMLYIYAEHENILPLLEEGMRLLSIPAPARQSVESYLPAGYQPPRPMKDADIATLLTDIAQNGPSLLRLTEMARCLRAEDLDEQLLLHTIDERGMRPLFSSVLQLLSEQVLLSEGFMPCSPADNSETQRLRQLLEIHGHI